MGIKMNREKERKRKKINKRAIASIFCRIVKKQDYSELFFNSVDFLTFALHSLEDRWLTRRLLRGIKLIH